MDSSTFETVHTEIYIQFPRFRLVSFSSALTFSATFMISGFFVGVCVIPLNFLFVGSVMTLLFLSDIFSFSVSVLFAAVRLVICCEYVDTAWDRLFSVSDIFSY